MDTRQFTLSESYRKDLEELLFQLSGKQRTLNLESHTNVICVGAFDQERLVGFAQLFPLHKTTFTMGHIEDVIVHKDYQGQGLGKKILLEIIDQAKTAGVENLSLTVRPEREAAWNLYESLGFSNPGNTLLRLRLVD